MDITLPPGGTWEQLKLVENVVLTLMHQHGLNGDEVLTTAGFQATSGSVIQKAIDHALYDLRASDFTDLGNDLGYVRALCHQ